MTYRLIVTSHGPDPFGLRQRCAAALPDEIEVESFERAQAEAARLRAGWVQWMLNSVNGQRFGEPANLDAIAVGLIPAPPE